MRWGSAQRSQRTAVAWSEQSGIRALHRGKAQPAQPTPRPHQHHCVPVRPPAAVQKVAQSGRPGSADPRRPCEHSEPAPQTRSTP